MRVREQAINHSRDVPNVERRRRNPSWARVPFFKRQVLNQLTDAFPYLKEDVRDGLQDGRDAFDGSSLPPLGL